ncbi:hypothetical protein BP422_15675 [Brevibacillus formosus]|uniref:Uncharacterized protein n=1 Tax=Brevibacillus formosus TaxID=54913 RepID=A0A220MJD0_9BACL|nr:hypothetical protein [Brevibacillus formosus]ASJ54879.1 hypothetical protein BP422_15675 [Brevibacillus formosus]
MTSNNLNNLSIEIKGVKVDMSEVNEQLKILSETIKGLNLPKIEIPPTFIQGVQEWQRISEEFSNTILSQLQSDYLSLKPELDKVFLNLSKTLRTYADSPALVTVLSSSVLTHIDSMPETPSDDLKIAIAKASDVTIDQIREVVREENAQSEAMIKNYVDKKFKESNRSSIITGFAFCILGIFIGAFISMYPEKVREAIADIGQSIEQTVMSFNENEVNSEK